MARHTCVLDVPAELSQMKVRDVLGIGLPLVTPERKWLLRLLHDMFRGWGQLHAEWGTDRFPLEETEKWPHAPFYDHKADMIVRLGYWLELADYFRYPNVVHFSSLPSLLDIVATTNWLEVSVRTRAHHRQVAENSMRFYKASLATLLNTA
eukprot:TRINITY_DN84572_c0_g1_i1.p1 TRINITY_DN84572_c0_g1~~TRINITY_DN84572_c0_g1_i1.p1  ORF type:complete len:158 (-),score=13.96 TRINITY_DN84572_c0_g1_i1:160-612(-)